MRGWLAPFRYQQNGWGGRKRSVNQLSRARRFVRPVAVKLSFHRRRAAYPLLSSSPCSSISAIPEPLWYILYYSRLDSLYHLLPPPPPLISPRIERSQFDGAPFSRRGFKWPSPLRACARNYAGIELNCTGVVEICGRSGCIRGRRVASRLVIGNVL